MVKNYIIHVYAVSKDVGPSQAMESLRNIFDLHPLYGRPEHLFQGKDEIYFAEPRITDVSSALVRTLEQTFQKEGRTIAVYELRQV